MLPELASLITACASRGRWQISSPAAGGDPRQPPADLCPSQHGQHSFLRHHATPLPPLEGQGTAGHQPGTSWGCLAHVAPGSAPQHHPHGSLLQPHTNGAPMAGEYSLHIPPSDCYLNHTRHPPVLPPSLAAGAAWRLPDFWSCTLGKPSCLFCLGHGDCRSLPPGVPRTSIK